MFLILIAAFEFHGRKECRPVEAHCGQHGPIYLAYTVFSVEIKSPLASQPSATFVLLSQGQQLRLLHATITLGGYIRTVG